MNTKLKGIYIPDGPTVESQMPTGSNMPPPPLPSNDNN